MHEIQITPNQKASFITLTYNEKNLPQDHSLNKEHFKDFFKRFRKAINPTRIRMYMCGEYGDISWRPHYHSIIFNYDFTEHQKYNKTNYEPRQRLQLEDTSNNYYVSQFLSALWTKGNHLITNCTFETAAYVARYCLKKINGKKAEEHYNRLIIDWNEFTGEIYNMQTVDLTPEYSTMSRGKNKPSGIGAKWYKKYKTDCYPSDYLINNGMKISVPKYYDSILKEENISLYEATKIERKINSKHISQQQLDAMHKCKMAQAQSMGRNKI